MATQGFTAPGPSAQRFSGKSALVLGGTRGIGRAIVDRLAAEGARVAFTYAQSAKLADEITAGHAAHGREALAIRADSGVTEDVQTAVARTVEAFGGIDILVVNSSLLIASPLTSYSVDDFQRVLDINVRGAFVAVTATIPHMKPGGRMITIGSNVAVRTGLPGFSVYTLTKAALAGFVRAASLDLAPLGITINNVQPGPTATDMLGTVTEVIEAVKSWVPLGRLADPAEIASIVAFVASAETAFMTGSTIPVDGGSVA